MRTIKVNNRGKTVDVLVDDDDYDRVSMYRWTLVNGYAVRYYWQDGKAKAIAMHREIMNVPKGLCTDHINHKRFDNRKCNLRIVTKKQNGQNILKRAGRLYIGVYWSKKHRSWEASVCINLKNHSIGRFKNARHAAMARDIFARDVYGEFGTLNFPNALHNLTPTEEK